MTRLHADKVALFLRQQREELTRIWRLARTEARPAVFPGLLDGLVEPFFARCAEVLPQGAAPEAVWRGLGGLVRWPLALAPDELSEEWSVLREVVQAACESINAAPSVSQWLVAATAACEAGTTELGDGEARPPGIVTALVYSSVEPRQAPSDRAPTA